MRKLISEFRMSGIGRDLAKKFKSLKAIDQRCTLEVTGGLNRPPMVRSAGVRKLFGVAKELAGPS